MSMPPCAVPPGHLRSRVTLLYGFVLTAIAAPCIHTTAAAQPTASDPTARGAQVVDIAGEAAVNGELERYLRVLDVQGWAPLTPWSLRPLAPGTLDRLWLGNSGTPEHPWAWRFAPADPASSRPVRIIRPSALLRYNTGYPFGSNDGPTWSGRGLTANVAGGLAGRLGPVTLLVAPTAFYTQNASFELPSNGRTDSEAYGDMQFPGSVDRPRRFGDGGYGRVDWGESTLRVDLAGAAVGFSTASQWWGPADRFPFLLGNNAGGFPHAFAGTSAPVNLWLARVHAQVIWGQLEQSDYFVPTGIARRKRFASGMVALVQPRGLPGLELGGARFFHAPWPDGGLPGRYISRPFESVLKVGLSSSSGSISTDDRSIDGENQLASIFARWVLPGSAFEVYGEYGRDDHNWDGRDLLVEPDHQASLLLGLRKQFQRADGSLLVVRAERMDFTANTLAARRGGGWIYLHASGSNQGHTLRGQLLGADAGVGSGGGAVLGADWYRTDGRWSVELQRLQRQEHVRTVGSLDDPRPLDVEYSLGVERLLFRDGLELRIGVTGSYDMNRDFERDRSNVSLVFGTTGLPRLRAGAPSRAHQRDGGEE